MFISKIKNGMILNPVCGTLYVSIQTSRRIFCGAISTAATPGLLCQPRVIVKMIVEKQMKCRLPGEPKFLEKTCPSATFVCHKIPHDHTRVWTRAAAVWSWRLTAWAMARPMSRRFLRNVGNHLPDYKLNCHYPGYLTSDTNELG
jgi:hypothetical protein